MRKLSKEKMSKAKYPLQNIEVTNYQMQNIEGQNIECSIWKGQNIDYRVGQHNREKSTDKLKVTYIANMSV